MDIKEATRQALLHRCGMTRNLRSWNTWKIYPFKRMDCLFVVVDKKQSYPNWNPTADDLIADDWMLID